MTYLVVVPAGDIARANEWAKAMNFSDGPQDGETFGTAPEWQRGSDQFAIANFNGVYNIPVRGLASLSRPSWDTSGTGVNMGDVASTQTSIRVRTEADALALRDNEWRNFVNIILTVTKPRDLLPSLGFTRIEQP